MYALRRGGCKCWLKHDQAPIAGVTLVWCIITDKQEMCTLSRDDVRICMLDMWVSFLDIVYVNNNVVVKLGTVVSRYILDSAVGDSSKPRTQYPEW